MYKVIQRYTRVNRGTQGYTRFTTICKSLKVYARVKRGIQASERAFFSYRSSTQDVQGWRGCSGVPDVEYAIQMRVASLPLKQHVDFLLIF